MNETRTESLLRLVDDSMKPLFEGRVEVVSGVMVEAAGVPAALVRDAEHMLDHDVHLAERDYYAYLDHPETGRSAYDGPVVVLSETPGELTAPAPLFGEHTFQVATEILGYSEEEVGELVASGVLT